MMKDVPFFTRPHVGFSRFVQLPVVCTRTVGPGKAAAAPDVIIHRPCRQSLTYLSFSSTFLLSKTPKGCILEDKKAEGFYPLGRSSRSHTARCTPGCPGGGCRFPDTRCRTPCSACWRGIPFLFHTKHSPGVRSSNGEVSTAKRHDGFGYHTAWVSSRPPASRRRGHTDVSTRRWRSICTGGLRSCCSTSLWRRPPRRSLHQSASGRRWWRTHAAFSYSVVSAGPNLGLD